MRSNGRMNRIQNEWPEWFGYIVAAVLTVALLGLRLLALIYTSGGYIRFFDILLVALVAYMAGIRPAFFAIILSEIVYIWIYVPPPGHFNLSDLRPDDWLQIITFPIAGIVTAIAISALKKSQKALAEGEEQYKELVQNANSAIIRWRHDGIITFFNEYAENFFGYKSEEIVGKNIRILVPAVDSGGVDLSGLADRIVAHPEDLVSSINENIRKDGSRVWISWSNKPILDENGQVVEILAVGSDITDRKRAEDRLKELEKKQLDFYRKTISAATNGKLIITDKDTIDNLASDPVATWHFSMVSDLAIVRHEAASTVESHGMKADDVNKFLTCVGETTSNALKHAGGGTASLYITDNIVLFTVSDKGPGINELNLPEVALVSGYSTTGTGGIGYKLILMSSDKVYLSTGPEGTTVTVQMALTQNE